MSDQRGKLVVWTYFQKVRIKLLALSDMNRHDIVLKTQLLEQDRDLVSVRRGPKIQVQHRVALDCLLERLVALEACFGQSAFEELHAVVAPERFIFEVKHRHAEHLIGD